MNSSTTNIHYNKNEEVRGARTRSPIKTRRAVSESETVESCLNETGKSKKVIREMSNRELKVSLERLGATGSTSICSVGTEIEGKTEKAESKTAREMDTLRRPSESGRDGDGDTDDTKPLSGGTREKKRGRGRPPTTYEYQDKLKRQEREEEQDYSSKRRI